MICVMLRGGLGNQMFQYAVARQLADNHGVEVVLDVRSFPYDIFGRRFALGRFELSAGSTFIGDPNAAPRLVGYPFLRAIAWRFRPQVLAKVSRLTLIERSFQFDPHVLRAPDETTLVGLFQSWRYFEMAQATLRDAFEVRGAPYGRNAELLAEIESCDAVCVHVRTFRQDWNPRKTSRAMGTQPISYYDSALRTIAERAGFTRVFVFADDIEWAKENFRLNAPTVFVDINGGTDGVDDLRLMAACRHFIIPNSTLSWWAAWLARKDGVVVAPRVWFAGQPWSTTDLVPPSWLRL